MAAAGETWRKTREIWPEKKTKPKIRVKVCYPEHYGAQGMWYATERISMSDLDGFLAQHPGAEIVETETVYGGNEV